MSVHQVNRVQSVRKDQQAFKENLELLVQEDREVLRVNSGRQVSKDLRVMPVSREYLALKAKKVT